MNGDAKKPCVPSTDHKAPPATAPRTGEGASTALEAMLRKRKQVEGPEPPDCDAPLPAQP
jgi:hypothetical protein